MKSIYSIVITVLIFASCHKEETPVAPHKPGENEYTEISIGSIYSDQVWFDLERNIEVSRNKKTAWDIAFQCDADSHFIILNSANNMRAGLTDKTEISDVTDTVGVAPKWDAPSGNLDSSAIGNWQLNSTIYVIDGGTDERGNHRGLSKLRFDSVVNGTLYFRYASWTDALWTNATLVKEKDYTYAYFSFNIQQQVTIAPPKNEYDIVFTQYTTTFYNAPSPSPYLVTGFLQNPYFANSTKVYDLSFEEINLNNSTNYKCVNRIDNIGYDWKTYDLNAGYYTVLTDQNYVLRTKSGKRYKMHFLDFYNSDGEKGTATIEFAEL